MQYELVFEGGAPIPHVRDHETYAAAEAEAHRVLEWMTLEGHPSDMTDSRLDRSAHPAIIYGADCGAHGVTIR
jgi:hypothetical protein